MVDVLIMAGASNNGSLQETSSEKYEAMIKLCDRPMVEYVLAQARLATLTNKIALIGPQKDLKTGLAVQADFYLNQGNSFLENLISGLSSLNQNKMVLLLTADIPLITAEALDDFIQQSLNKKGDGFYPLIRKELCEREYPGIQRTYIRLKDGTYTGGNIALINPRVIFKNKERLEKVFLYRKQTWKLSRLLGFAFTFRFAIGRLSLQQVEKKILNATNIKAIGVKTEYAEIGFDIDKPQDLLLAKQYLMKREMSDEKR